MKKKNKEGNLIFLPAPPGNSLQVFLAPGLGPGEPLEKLCVVQQKTAVLDQCPWGTGAVCMREAVEYSLSDISVLMGPAEQAHQDRMLQGITRARVMAVWGGASCQRQLQLNHPDCSGDRLREGNSGPVSASGPILDPGRV